MSSIIPAMESLLGVGLGVCVLLLTDMFLGRYASSEFRSGSRIFLGGFVLLALVVYYVLRLPLRLPWTWEVGLYVVALIVSVTLIILGLVGLFISAIKSR